MQENFFDLKYNEKINDHAPLAIRMRPQNLDEFIGQAHIVGKGKLLYRLIAADKLTSVLFYHYQLNC